MSRETMIERNANPEYFEIIQCEECGSYENLTLHKFSQVICCGNCADNALIAKKKEDDRLNINGREYDEDRAKEERDEKHYQSETREHSS